MDDGQERVLTVTNYVLDENEQIITQRVTIAPHMVHFVIATNESYDLIEGRDIRKLNVIMSEGVNLQLCISLLDLVSLERAIGTYFLP